MKVFVARQPIFEQGFRVFAYEMLFRQGEANEYNAANGEQATASVITNSLWVMGLDYLTNGKKIFINVTEKMLKENALSLLPPDQVVLEILETVEPDAEVIKNCRKLKSQGFMLVLDDFVFQPRFQPLVEIADIIKVDFLTTGLLEQKRLIRQCENLPVRFLAEKVETNEQYEQALSLGYDYFQGYFFSKPVVLSAKDIPANKLSVFKILQEIRRPELQLDKLRDAIQKDVSLAYKLLAFINSAHFGFRSQIGSIQQALALLGKKEIVKWMSLVALKEIAEGKSDELLMNSLVRGRLCELVAAEIGLVRHRDEAFTMGLFSLVDALLNKPLADILKLLPLPEAVQEALLGRENAFFRLLELARACERGDWPMIQTYAKRMDIELAKLWELVLLSIKWSKENE